MSSQDVQSRLALLENAANGLEMQVMGFEQILENFEARLHAQATEERRKLLENVLRQRSILCERLRRRVAPAEPVDLTPTNVLPLEECFHRLQAAAPDAFVVWHDLLDVNARTYDGFPTHSCSVDGHEMAESFGHFLSPYLTGTVLDVGCGPQPVPVYLRGHSTSQLAGIDPLPPESAHPFAFAQGVCEHLPWPDDTFDVVVVATSLDHVLLLDRSLEEIRRVLKPDGCAALWVSFVAGAERYDPYRAGVAKIDDFHLFHFDRTWFEEMMAETGFVPVETISFVESNGSCFYTYAVAPR
jgi:ubiquinone/menaquinone biosynthesis C-methylase UbiE